MENALIALVLVFGVPAALMYFVAAWQNAREGVAFYQNMVESYEEHVRFGRQFGQPDLDRTLATLIKHRRSLRRARTYSWPFTIRTDQAIIDGATEDEKRVDPEPVHTVPSYQGGAW